LEGDHNKRNNYTDNQVAKMSGVGVGTVARYNKVMNSNDKMLNI
jgi:transposase